MNDDGVAIIELQQLVFAAPLDAIDAPTFCAARTRWSEFFPERRMYRAHSGYGFAERGFG
jgi:hypothetical protein